MSEIKYIFKFEDENKVFEYNLSFDNEDNSFIGKQGVKPPKWTELDNCKCSHCPLVSSNCSHCPMAVNLADFVEDIKEMLSYKKVTMVIVDPNRTYVKKTDLQSGLFGMFGLVMATSDCPHMKFLRPLSRFHLPFSSVEETIFRVSSMFILGQYVKNKKGGNVSVDLEELKKAYLETVEVNEGLLGRIRALEKGDAGKNAIVALNLFAQMFEMEFSNDLSAIEKFF